MISTLLLAGLLAAPVTTAALFAGPVRRGRRTDPRWRWAGRFVMTLVCTAVMIAALAAGLDVIGVTHRNIAAAAIGLAVASVAWLPVTRRWGVRGHLCWATTTYAFAVYLAFMLWWTFASHLGVAGTIGGLVLWALEVAAAVLGCAYLWELCDTLGRVVWERRVGRAQLPDPATGPFPLVCLQVPCYNEPPEMVIETLDSLRSLHYPNVQIQVIDDNTDDEALWRPVEAWCREHGIQFVHLSDWPGFKSGALNYALQNMVPDSCELIGVVDSDYQIDPQFLSRCVPLFDDPVVGFIQAPQDYRDWESAPFYRRLYYSYRYFFSVTQPSRNERNGAIFAGTMGLIRREALEQIGGWDEWCITEDADLSLRLLRAGWSGLHVDTSFGKGIMPLTFEALKGQRFRWCFGGIQILRRHWRSLLPGRRTPQNQLTNGQRWAYLTGAIQWYGDLLALLFFIFLLVGAANIAFGGGVMYRKLTGFLLAVIPMLVVLGLLRAVALLRRGTGASWGDALGAFLIWQATSLTVARASVQALFAKQAVFLRTPKTHEESALSDALRANWAESLLGVLGMLGIGAALSNPTSLGGPLLAMLLVWPTVSFLAAPLNSVSAQHAALPAALRERRRTEYLRTGGPRLTYAFGGLAAAAAMAAVAVTLFVPGRGGIVPPRLLGPAQGKAVNYAAPSSGATSSGTSSNPSSSTSGGTSTTTGTTTTGTTTTPTTTTPTTTTPTTTTPTTTTPTTTTPSTTSSTSTTTP
jgi:cellulose synthase/poly-beta-1,6-N-acetylglucosamine synthase-like glycosyltransferase